MRIRVTKTTDKTLLLLSSNPDDFPCPHVTAQKSCFLQSIRGDEMRDYHRKTCYEAGARTELRGKGWVLL